MPKNSLENGPEFGHASDRRFASPVLGRKHLRSVCFKGRQRVTVGRATVLCAQVFMA
jgi:hypothetical protein